MEEVIMENETKVENLTIMNLLYFFLNQETEIYNKNVIRQYISEINKNIFWLGGYIKMNQDSFINLKLIQKVKDIRQQQLINYGEPCNSFEIMSCNSSLMQLKLVENMIIKYNEINKIDLFL